ncbi:TetR/AcrR family transcriptional regulator [Schaalia sp. 19OD2882]|uniref:TetR/AcrR family transcriptional regulator n=1 Tax=Schaalia sp. 19OD2882 TaxID=2794089 RepID=UPI001C1E982D|nr:TetR/AcrR family transcriptional regulator [Schaalia sp. 19OD2882]QWW18971.1 TetR/AcrR family transcriptional regulator [Schaalia sp. 19OD2882]
MIPYVLVGSSRPGRPRDPQLEERIHRTALDLYGEVGWTGFNLTKIAAAAGVGKSSLYSRWSDRDELLRQSFATLVVCPGPVGESPEEILVNEAEFRLREYLGPNRSAMRRLFVEAGNAEDPVICRIYEDVFVKPLSAIRERLWDFKVNGELPRNTSLVRLLDAIEGSVLMRTFCLRDDFIECFLEKVPAYVADLVSDQLHHHEPSRQLDWSDSPKDTAETILSMAASAPSVVSRP